MNTIIGLKELRENTEQYILATQRGHSFTVVRRSVPIFKMIPVDKWGDEGNWETILDLTKGKDKKITAEQLLSYMRTFDAKQSRKVSKKA